MSGIYIVMGVSGCGKSSVARLLAEETNGLFLDGDDFHRPANKAKMAAGHPLTDQDRWGWLHVLNAELQVCQMDQRPVFLACSALREIYRQQLTNGLATARFIYLCGTKELIQSRLASRFGHFMSPTLLDSQFATLEEPTDALVADITDPVPEIVAKILAQIRPTS